MKVTKRSGQKNKQGRKKGKELHIIKTRKEVRKEQRKAKKAKKDEFFKRKRNVSSKSITHPSSVTESEVRKEEDVLMQQNRSDTNLRKSENNLTRHISLKQMEGHKREKFQIQMNETRKKQLRFANLAEDKIIKKLEKQLRLNKRKNKSVPKCFATDGLDYLLDVCDQDKVREAVAIEQNLLDSGSEFEEDFTVVTGIATKKSIPGDATNTDLVKDDEIIGSETVSPLEDGNSNSEDSVDFNIGNHCKVPYDCSGGDGNSSSDEVDADSLEVGTLPTLKKVLIVEDKHRNEINLVNHSNLLFDNIKTTMCNDPCQSRDKNKRKIKLIDGDVLSELTSRKRVRMDLKDPEINIVKIVGKGKNETERQGVTERKPTQTLERKCLNYSNLDPDHNSEDDVTVIQKKSVCTSVENTDGSDSTYGETGKKAAYWEDIYGRTRDKKGNVIQESSSKYVPPQLRVETIIGDAKKQEQLQQLKKQVKGLLNRLAESNMSSIATQLDRLYMTNSRNDMNETVTQLLLESLVTAVLAPERLVMEYVLLVAILHGNVGTEVGAHFLHTVVKKFHEMHKDQQVESKELDNIILILSHLYNFKVFSASLMYSILDQLVVCFSEKDIELLLLVLRSVGFALRKDDPTALRELVLRVQQKACTAKELHDSSRVKFMLDILLAIKNNNMSKIPNYDLTHSEHLNKLMKSFLRKGNYVTELKISLDDLLKVEEQGRWWVIGSAWRGQLPGKMDSKTSSELHVGTAIKPQHSFSQQLLELARKQRMNTDVRRNIFCILMTAEDYLDAFQKLLHLGLKNHQEREIVYVIIHCCLQEKEFNPYYGFISQKLCDFDRKYQMTIQYALWDKFKELHNLSVSQMANMARLLVHLLIEKGLPLSVLKVIDFAEVDKTTVRFMRQVLLSLLLHKSLDAMRQVFQRVALVPKLHMFREGLHLFVHHFLLRKTESLPPDDVHTLKERATVMEKMFAIAEPRTNY